MCSNRSETWIDYGERRITAAVVVGGGERRDSDAGSCHLISGEERTGIEKGREEMSESFDVGEFCDESLDVGGRRKLCEKGYLG
ncbi:hypothetical protein Bca4012_081351 [Brassica carinata]